MILEALTFALQIVYGGVLPLSGIIAVMICAWNPPPTQPVQTYKRR